MVLLQNRQEAGKKLATRLERYRSLNPIVLGMPRGGVVVAYEIAQVLVAPLDVIVALKVGAPNNSEFAIGAIAPGDVVAFNDEVSSFYDFESKEVQAIVKQEKEEMRRRIALYRAGLSPLNLKDRVVIIVDDGVATGQSAIAAVRSVRKMQPAKVVLAVGVAAREAVAVLGYEVDEIVCLATPEPFQAVGLWYQDFTQTEDGEVIKLLQQNNALLSKIPQKPV